MSGTGTFSLTLIPIEIHIANTLSDESLRDRWRRRIGKSCALQLKVAQARLTEPGRHLQMKIVQVSDPSEFPCPILCVDRNEELLPRVYFLDVLPE